MIIDTHAHLLYQEEKDSIILNMAADGLARIINIGTTAPSSALSVELARENKDIYAAVGIHPDYASQTTKEDLDLIDSLAGEEKVVAIGEIGLDYHNNDKNKDAQKEIFMRQLDIAVKYGLPVCIHSRDAADDTLEILKAYKNRLAPSVMHCYSYNGEYAKKFIELGFYISFSGNITYKKSDRSYLASLPLDRILVETDSPYLSPEPLRGTNNVPKNVKITAQKIADVLEMDYEKFEKITVENAFRVFKKMR